jgi:hypothetical protein
MVNDNMKQTKWIDRNDHMHQRLNIKQQINQLSVNPLIPLLIKIKGSEQEVYGFYSDEISRYVDAFHLYHLSLKRFLPELSYMMRWNKSLRYVKGREYSAGQRKLAENYHSTKHFFALDFFNCLVHARILMDRIAGVSRSFISGTNVPSFTSFSDQKKFFQKQTQPYGAHEEYALYMKENTSWFDLLKDVRDHFVVHHGPSHSSNFGYNPDGWDMTLTLQIPNYPVDGKLKNVIIFSVPQMAHDIQTFLIWFNKYGLQTLEEHQSPTSTTNT